MLNLLYPIRCACCDDRLPWAGRQDLFCRWCQLSVECGAATGDANERGAGLGCLHALACIYRYTGAIRQLIQSIKYRGRYDLLSRLMSGMRPHIGCSLTRNGVLSPHTFESMFEREVIVIAVPPNPRAFLLRDRCHVSWLAGAIARHIGAQYSVGALRRIDDRRPQANMLRSQRCTLRASDFSYLGKNIVGRRVLLVDDVVTTGATANACATVLIKHGALFVDLLTVAG